MTASLFNVATVLEPKHSFRSALHSQSRLNFDGGSDTVGTISVGDGGVLFAGAVAEQQHLVVEGALWPSDVGKRARGGVATRVVEVAMVDEVDRYGPHGRPKSGRESAHTESVCADVVTSETVHLSKITAVLKGAKGTA